MTPRRGQACSARSHRAQTRPVRVAWRAYRRFTGGEDLESIGVHPSTWHGHLAATPRPTQEGWEGGPHWRGVRRYRGRQRQVGQTVPEVVEALQLGSPTA
jgi:hypothetical protein